MHTKSLMLATFALLGVANLSAMDLSIDQAVEQALAHNRSLESSRIDLSILEQDDKYSWNSLLPKVSVSTALRRANHEGKNPANMGATENYWNLATSLSFSWNFTPALLTKMEATHQSYLNGQLTWQQAVADTTLNVKKLYYAIKLQEASVEIEEETLENTKKRMDQTENLYNEGFASELQYLQTQVSYENLKTTVKKDREAVNEQKRTLGFLLGLDDEELNLTSPIEAEFVDVDAQKALERVGYRFDVRSLQGQRALLSTNLKALDQASWIPVFSASATGSPTVYDISHDWFDKVDDNGLGNFTDTGAITFALSFNITDALPWSGNRQTARQLKQNLRKLDTSIAMVEANARVEIKNLVEKLGQAQDSIESAERNIALAQKSYDMTSEAYENGNSELLAVNDAQQSLNQAKLGKMNDTYTYLCALLDLEYATQDNL